MTSQASSEQPKQLPSPGVAACDSFILILGMHMDTNSAVRPAVALQRELRQVSAWMMSLKEPKESSSKESMQLPIKNPVSTNTEKLPTCTKHITTWAISLQRWGPRDPYFFLLCFWFFFKMYCHISHCFHSPKHNWDMEIWSGQSTTRLLSLLLVARIRACKDKAKDSSR